jgi:DedD protein
LRWIQSRAEIEILSFAGDLMRDFNRLKDKVELSLDGRQIFFLFFGSAVLVCLAFVSGVVVGKRVEARALALSSPASDPLAALDQLGDVEDEGLTYHRTLTQRPPKRAADPTKASQRETKLSGDGEPSVGTASVIPAKKAEAKKPDPPIHFTLQLSTFAVKSEAEEYVHKLQVAGYRPIIVQSETPGKGLLYRVRMGDYTSRQAAVEAQNEFERKQRKSAYVAKL